MSFTRLKSSQPIGASIYSGVVLSPVSQRYPYLQDPPSMINFDLLIDIVADEFNMPPHRVTAKSRYTEYVRPRWLAMTIFSEVHSLAETARMFDKLSHKTILHAQARCAELAESNPHFRGKCINVIQKVKKYSKYLPETIKFDPI